MPEVEEKEQKLNKERSFEAEFSNNAQLCKRNSSFLHYENT
jgi:hypothetical protein